MLLIGPPGSGKTHFALAALERALQERRAPQVRLVVPTASMAQHLTHILARRGRVVPGELIQTLADFVAHFTPDLTEPTVALESYLLQKAIASAGPSQFGELAAARGLKSKLASVIAEFQAAASSAATIQAHLRTPQQIAFGAVLSEYETLLDQRGLVSRNERLLRAANEIRRQRLDPVRELYFDGFLNFSQGEKELIEAASETAETAVVTWPQDIDHPFRKMTERRLEVRFRPQTTPAVVSAASPQNEIEEIARLILETGRPYRDFLLIVRSLEVYAPLIQSIFERFGVPFRLRAPRPLSQHGAIRFLSGLLGAAAEGFPGAKTLETLRQPYSPIGLFPQTDIFDFRVQERLPNHGLPFLLEQAEDLDHVRDCLERLGGLREWGRESASPSQWGERCRALRLEWLRLPEVHDRIERTQALELRELARALRQFDDAAVEAADLLSPSGYEVCSLADYLAVLDDVLLETALRTADQRHDVVNVVTVFEARQWEIPIAFVCGLVERQFPRYYPQDLFFPDEDRRRLRKQGFQLRTSGEREREERFLYDIATTRATEKLVLTHARRDEREQPLLRSFLLPADYNNDRPTAPVRVREQAASFDPKKPPALKHPELLQEILARHASFSPSSLETYLQCPFQFFAGKTLRLKGPPDDPERRLDPLVVGSIIHRAIANWSATPDQPIDRALDAVLDETLETRSIRKSFHTEMLRYNLRTDLARFVSETLSRPLGDPAGQKREAEVRYVIDDTEQLFINGRIDRYDVFGDNFGLIVDYKYSSENRVETIVKEHGQGMRLQAPLYLLGLERNLGIRPAGMRFWGLRRKTTVMGWVVDGLFPKDQLLTGDEALSAEQFQEKLDRAVQTALQAIREIRAGRIEVEPVDRGFCSRFCDFRAVCRVEL
ncbi:MAG: PD-(D/E)XK nuclease family protein [Bryobacterales bacterium]